MSARAARSKEHREGITSNRRSQREAVLDGLTPPRSPLSHGSACIVPRKGKVVRFSVIKNGVWFTVLVGCRWRLWTQFCVAIGMIRVLL